MRRIEKSNLNVSPDQLVGLHVSSLASPACTSAAARIGDFPGEIQETFFAPRMEDDGGALCGEVVGNRATDAGAGAGDEGNPAEQCEGTGVHDHLR